MTAVLITGAAGTLGQGLLSRLRAGRPGLRVVALDTRPVPGDAPAAVLTVPFGGPFDDEQRAALAEVTAVVHLAARMRVVTVPDGDRWTGLTEPVRDLQQLLTALPRLRQVVFASSYMVYAVPPAGPLTERDALGPINLYAWEKCAVEQYLNHLPARTCSLRFTGVYGPGVPIDLGRAVTEVMAAVVEGREMRANRPGTSVRNHLYVGDAVEALYRAVTEEWSGTYNVAGPEPVSVRDLISAAAEVSGAPVPMRWHEGGASWDALLDCDLVAGRYGFRAATGLTDGLREYHAWALAQHGSAA